MPVLTGGQVLERDGGQVMPCEGGALLEGGLYNVGDHGLIEEAEEPVMGMGPYRYSGVPPNGYKNGIAEKGAYLVEILTGDTYRNTGTKAATVWTADAPSGGGDVVTVAAAAPVAPNPGQLWARQLDVSGGYQLYRFAGGASWQALGAGVGAGATDGPFEDTVARQVGTIVGDPDDGYFAGLAVNTSDGVAHIKYESADGATSAEVECTPTSLRLSYLGTSHFPTILLDESGLQFYGVPTADPVVAGALWSDGGTLKISAG
jgi:hypothetical protein